MNRRPLAALALAALLAGTAACASDEPTMPATSAAPAEPSTEAAEATASAQEPEESATVEDGGDAESTGAITPAGDLYDAHSAYGVDPASAVAEYGADATFLGVVRNSHPLETLEATDDEILTAGRDVCERYDTGASPDEVYEQLVAEVGGDATGLEDMFYTFMLTAPDTLCTEHAAMRDAWMGSTDE